MISGTYFKITKGSARVALWGSIAVGILALTGVTLNRKSLMFIAGVTAFLIAAWLVFKLEEEDCGCQVTATIPLTPTVVPTTPSTGTSPYSFDSSLFTNESQTDRAGKM